MTIQEIIDEGNFITPEEEWSTPFLRVDLPSLQFGGVAECHVFGISPDSPQEDLERMAQVVNSSLNISDEGIANIKDVLWKHFEVCVENTSYNMVDESGYDTEADANRGHFEIFSKEDAFRKTKLGQVIYEMEQEDLSFRMWLKCPWEHEHGVNIQFDGGKILDWY
jgi:hypothetical protein